MSRIGKKPIPVPTGVKVAVNEHAVSVEGPKGKLSQAIPAGLSVTMDANVLTVERSSEQRTVRALHGLIRSLLANMVHGVTKGFERKLTLVGVGYRAQAQGDKLNLSLGFSHPVVHQMPEGVKAETPSQTEIVIKGIDKQKVGQTAAEVRGYRPPEPYKGKGVRYADEVVILKETKKK